MTLHELGDQYQIDPEIIRIWQTWEGETLLPVQERAIREGQILAGQDLLVSAPTSSGKTFLAEIAAIHTIYQRKHVLYLLPLKALAEEKYADFCDKYEAFGIDVVISTGDRTEFDAAIERGEFQLAVMVFEKAIRLLARNRHFINNCGLVVVDEIQMTADYSRGASLEILLTAILTGRKTISLSGQPPMVSPQFIALSAVLEDLNHLDEWLGLKALMCPERPVELLEGILRKDGVFTYRSYLSKTIGADHFPPFPEQLTFNLKSVEGRREYEYRRLQHVVSHLVAQGEQVLIFLKWKVLTRDIALRLARDLQLPSALPAIEAVHLMEESLSKEMLLESLRHGVAFHNADLGRDERRAIEQHFKAEQSKIRVICATSTLAMGINLPVKTVIINNLEKPDPEGSGFQEIPLSAAEYKNMSGRAGRLKRHDLGRSIMFAETSAEEQILWRNYIDGPLPRMDSLLVNEPLLQETLFLAAAGICDSEAALVAFLRRTYAGMLRWANDVEAAENMRGRVRNAVTYCLAHELMVRFPGVTPDGTVAPQDRLQATEIGQVCASQGVLVESFVLLKDLFAELDPAACDVWELLFIATHNRELEELHFRLSPAAFESGEYWRATEELNPSNWEHLAKRSETILQSRFEVTKRLKMTLLLLDWISGMSVQRLEVKYSQFYRDKSYSGAIRGLAENVAWMLRLLADLAAVRHAAPPIVQRLQHLAQMVLYGVNEGGIELAALHVPGLNRLMVMQLVRAGYSREEQVLDVELEELARIIPKEIAFRLQDRLFRKYSRLETRHLADQKLRLERLGYDSAPLKRIYSAPDLTQFDMALQDLFRQPSLKLLISEVISGDKRTGYDYTLESPHGVLFVRILPPNVRELSDDLVGNLLTMGLRYTPTGFILIGRPDFTETAYARARRFAVTYAKPIHLYPAYEIGERYVRALEGVAPFALV